MRTLGITISLVALLCLCSACATPADCGHLVTDYNNLVAEHNELVAAYNKLNAQIEQYAATVEEYRGRLEEYIRNIPKLLEGAIVPPYLLVENRKVNLVFRNLDGNIEHWYWKVEALESSILLGQFMRGMSISDLRYLGLRDVASRFPEGSKYVQLKDKGSYLDLRPYIMTEGFEPIALEFFSRHAHDEDKIREVWNMVTQLNTYSLELKDTPRLPLETLLLGGGDCEDLAILTASILKAMPINWKVSLVYMDADSPARVNKINHAAVHVDTGKFITFVESTQRKVMCPWDKVDGFYLEIK